VKYQTEKRELENEISDLREKLGKLSDPPNIRDLLRASFSSFTLLIDQLESYKRKQLMNDCLSSCILRGESLDLNITAERIFGKMLHIPLKFKRGRHGKWIILKI